MCHRNGWILFVSVFSSKFDISSTKSTFDGMNLVVAAACVTPVIHVHKCQNSHKVISTNDNCYRHKKIR